MRMTLVLIALVVASCGATPGEEPDSSDAEVEAVKSESIDGTLARHAERLMAHEGIQGIYVGETEAGDACLVIMATVPADELGEVVPDSLEGWPVRIESGDEIRPLD